jgi:succinate dehydrogenase / fumarate reductase flavoprotein subunit
MARNEAGLKKALARIPELRREFWEGVRVPGTMNEFNPALDRAARIADFLEFAELLCRDALHRNESCGGHFRTEYQTPDGEARRNDAEFAYVGAWEFKGLGAEPALHKEPLTFENLQLAERSYK